MSDDLSPEEDVVRRLLAQARHDEPAPPDVVARLDARLAELRAERTAPEQAADRAPVTDLSAARARRRRVPALLAAAAALVVGGVALSSVLDQTNTASDSATAGDAGAGAERDEALASESAESLDESDAKAGADAGAEAPSATAPVPELSDDAGLRAAVRPLASPGAVALLRSGTVPPWPECATTPLGAGTVVWVLVDARPGAVVVELDPSREASTAQVWACGDTSPLRVLRYGSR